MVYDLGIIKRQRYVEPTFIGTGGTVTTATSNSTLYVYHTFTANSVFVPVYNVTAECLIVAGGGAGSDIAGGGAGGFRSLTINFQKNNAYAITVGQGGTTATIVGYDSSIIGNNVSYTANGGGAGGQTGGSGGGGTGTPGSGAAGNTPFTSPSQGNDGGDSAGGGAGGAGSGTVGGSGSTWLNDITYAGGGSGGGGASAGGGAGSAGTPNTGGGGSIGNFAGGSGIVIIRYRKYQASVPAAFDASFAYTSLLLSNQSSSIDFSTGVVNMLVIGGGGGGGAGNSGVGTSYYGGGGGAGGLYVNSFSPTGSTTFVVTVGAGGAGFPGNNGGDGTSGNSSTIRGKIVGDTSQTIIAAGGGFGRGYGSTGAAPAGANGGSGGGSTRTLFPGVSTLPETDGPNYFGHSGFGTEAGGRPFAGGGGAGSAGTDTAGGAGKYISIASSSTFSTTFAKGGGPGLTEGAGALGGNGGGGGGGPGSGSVLSGYAGGAGLVFFWHLTTATVAVGGGTGAYAISIQGDYTIYAFINGSGTITFGPKFGNDYLKDSSSAANLIQASGSRLAQGSFNPYSTNWSTYFNGTTDYLSIQHSDAFNISSDFTVEGWFYPTSASTSTIITKSATVENSPFKITISAQNTVTTSIGYTTQPPSTVEYLVVAGGGGGGGGDVGSIAASGGGGAGGYLSGSLSIVQGVTYTVTVGAGGSDGAFSASSGTAPTSGSNSSLSTITAIGGGYGGHQGSQTGYGDGAVGGSGGGGASGTTSGANVGSAGTPGQGFAGGNAVSNSAAGGGGAGAAGGDGVTGAGGNGGAGKQWLDGNYYAGGGGGAARSSGTQGTGGIGGGSSATNSANTPDASPNTGGGGGGVTGGTAGNSAGNGGSGIVIIRYSDTFAPAQVTTGTVTVTVSGGYRYYTWQASGSVTFGTTGLPEILNSQVNLNTWNHVSLTRSGTTYTSTLNGGNLVTVNNTGTIYNNTQSVYIGYDGTNYFQGYISNIRFLNGTGINALPKLPFPLIDNTTLLVSATRSVVDKSSYNFTVSQNGTPAIRRFSPFVNSGPYNTLISGGSVYFDGGTDFLTVNPNAVNFQNNSFNIEFWSYPEPITTTAYFIDSRYNTSGSMTFGTATTSTNDGMSVALQTSGLCTVSLGTSTTLTSINLENLRVKFRAWNHIAVVRNDTLLSLYINGNYAGSTSTSVTITTVTTSSYAALATSAFGAGGNIAVEYLVVAGGGGGGSAGASNGLGGGGGAGGFRTNVTGATSGGGGSAESTYNVTDGTTVTVTVGAGGVAVTGNNRGTPGTNSVFGTITSAGGGGGSAGDAAIAASTGGSGGGGGNGGGAVVRTGAAGTANQGYSGGTSVNSGQNYPAAGGGGAGAAGSANPTNLQGGAGGAGVSSSITGSAVTYAGGGGGGINTVNGGASPGAGGAGGGGAGGINSFGTAGTINTGGGGGGSGGDNATGGGAGGSGIVIIRYADTYPAASATTSSVTISGYRVYIFTASGSITFPVTATTLVTNNFSIGRSSYLSGGYYKGYISNLNILKGTISNRVTYTAGALANTIEYLIVGAGGGGLGNPGGYGGGGGGFRYGSFVTTQPGATYSITVGAGGSLTGGNSSIVGGGINLASAGGGAASASNIAGSGGSGSGNYGTGNTPSTSPPQGYDGGLRGGGGAGSAGSGYNGGTGSTSTITGSSLMYAGGGGGNTPGTNIVGGAGGAGGGGFGWTFLKLEYLIVAGGGAGGNGTGGGGGAGGFTTGTIITTQTNATYTITVGAGGPISALRGSDSIISSPGIATITSYGGGGGGGANRSGTGGGSGGGGAVSGSGGKGVYPGSAYISAARQGYDGGSGNVYTGGGGGGAGQEGVTTGGSYANGGAGLDWPPGSGTYYAGGGGAGGTSASGGFFGGSGGTGTPNTGGGGGGASGGVNGGPGGSGIIIIRYLGPGVATGGTVSTSSGYTYHTFLTTGVVSFVENIYTSTYGQGTAGIRGNAANGGTNTGGGGGGGGSGGSGIVAIRYLGQPRGFGGNITTNVYGLYTVHTFLASDTYVDSKLTYALPYAPVTSQSTSTSLLINAADSKIFDATTQNNIYQIGDTSVSNSVVRYNATSMYFDGDGDGLGIGGSTSTTTATNLTAVGSGDFTVEMWMYPLSLYNTATAPGLLDSRTTSTSVPGSAYLGYTGVTLTNGSQIGWKDDTTFVTTGTVIINTWNYVSVVRAGSALTMYVNGAATSSTTNTTNYTIPFKYIGISYNLLSFNGYIDDLRITQTARADVFPLTYPQLK